MAIVTGFARLRRQAAYMLRRRSSRRVYTRRSLDGRRRWRRYESWRFAPGWLRTWMGGSRRSVLALAAIVALLQPLLTPVLPDLAGWQPDHHHIYVNGVPVPHSHPWDRDQAGEQTEPQRFAFHPCELHPDGIVPLGDAVSVGEGDAPADGMDEGVTFVFDLSLTAGALPVTSVAVVDGAVETVATGLPADADPGSVSTRPDVPPPRA